MRVWVTRAQPGAASTAAKLRALGHDPVIAPLLEVRPLPVAIDLDGVGALAFTSANGVRAFAGLCPERGLPVFTVGAATAEAARAAGFADVTSADGDVDALGRLLAGRRIDGAVLAPGAKERAGHLDGARLLPVYETVATGAALPEGVNAALVHSPKAGALLAGLLDGRDAGGLTVLAISEAAARPLTNIGLQRLAWAAHPSEETLLALLALG